MATVYAVASAKGGVGKTTTTAAVATLLADSGADVVAIDADLGMANLAAAVGVTPGGITLHDVLAGAADPPDAVHEGPAGLRVVPGAADLDAYAAAEPSGLRDVVDAFDDADYVFVDAGAGLSHDSTLPLGLADETLLVSTAERSALGDTEKTRQLTERLGGSVAGAAITRLDPATAADDGPIDAVEETLATPVIGRIPEDDAVLRAAEADRALPLFAPDAAATRAYRDLTRALTGAAIDGPGLAAVDATTEDAEADDETNAGEDGSPPDAEGPDESADPDEAAETDDSGGTDVSLDEEEIIVADSDQGGLGEPGDEEDIIVAAESPVEDIGEAEDADPGDPAEDDAESDPEAAESGAVGGETETVGEAHVDGDDLEAMIESGPEAERFDEEGDETPDSTGGSESSSDGPADAEAPGEDAAAAGPADTESPAEPSADETPETDRESESAPEPSAETGPKPDEELESDPDDELAGSVPFRDDDTGTMHTALSEGEDDEDDEDDNEGGFFSRLLGR
ncbi:MinD/ParA family ATP-binding protein [Halorubrum lipolyticum]|uniref:Cobyrinic acid ac-diamide synthase n=1 Tax=Halorubrum lipolyticum DSM 21995 TaxID=1227482 RepID=M0NVD6_9EURY|nr:MinD/ParA family protein [Halorubrum lipolyticum]EMA61503.1 cobyrinic acid ac-diamide synthase [Halorubrum lipolyticum DSM 21995]